MSVTRKTRVPMQEQIRLINECRQRGLTDTDWCRENGVAVRTFCNWVSRCHKAAADQILPPNYGLLENPRRDKMSFPLTLYRIPFRNNMRHRRCRNHTLTIHIQLKLL